MGFPSLRAKTHLPTWLLFAVAYVAEVVGYLLGTTLKLNVFNVRMLTMHRWFDITAAKDDLQYAPIVSYADGWTDTLAWFREHWLPNFLASDKGLFGISSKTQEKIDVQAAGTH